MHNTFFTADLHFGHKNIIKYDQRPFFTVKEMDEELIQRWNKKVKQNDSVYILGDISFYPAKETTEILKRLNGSKTLVIGNHDKKLIRSKDVQNQFREVSHYIEIDVDTVTHGRVHVIKIQQENPSPLRRGWIASNLYFVLDKFIERTKI